MILKVALVGICGVTLFAVSYLTLSVIILHPPRANAPVSFMLAGTIVLVSLLGLATAFPSSLPQGLRLSSAAGAALAATLGFSMVQQTLASDHFEGYALIIGAILVVQGVLMIAVALPRASSAAR